MKTYTILLKEFFILWIGHCNYSYHLEGYEDIRHQSYDSFLMRLQTEGSAEATIEDQHFLLEYGDIILVPSGCYYHLKVHPDTPSGDFHIFANGDWIDHWWTELNQPFHVKVSDAKQMTTLWNFLSTETRRPPTEQNHELIGYFFKSICLLIKQESIARSAKKRPFVVTEMMRYIEEHALDTFMIEEVARSVDLSVSRSVHLFKEYTGKTMIEYAHDIRLTAAISQMKYTNMTLDHIAENCGFGNYPYFHRVFKKAYGQAPGQYRRTL